MALLKKCNHCSEKGFFLKLTDGLCENCKLSVENLEQDYINLLQKIALSSDNKNSAIEDLNILISKAKPFDGIANVSVSVYKNLLAKLSRKDLSAENMQTLSNTKHQEDLSLTIDTPNIITSSSNKILNNIKTSSINLNLNSVENLDLKNNVKPSEATISVIKNLIEPLSINTNSINENTTKTLNLNIQDSTLKTLNQIPTTSIDKTFKEDIPYTPDSHSIKDTFILNKLNKKHSMLLSELNSPNVNLNLIAKNYFHIKNKLLPTLKDMPNFSKQNLEIQNTLENAKNILCIRSKKSENELFDFFNYVTIFIQTTGNSPVNNDIIEISATKVSYGEIVDEFYSLVNPIKSIKISVINSTGISNEDIENKPTIDMITPALMEFIGDHQLVAFNPKPIELFLNPALKNLNIKLINKTPISIRSLYRIRYKNYYGYPSSYSDLSNICLDLLSSNDVEYINQFKSLSASTSHAVYKLYEILKFRYK